MSLLQYHFRLVIIQPLDHQCLCHPLDQSNPFPPRWRCVALMMSSVWFAPRIWKKNGDGIRIGRVVKMCGSHVGLRNE